MKKTNIYKIVNVINNKCYIGQTTKSLETRLAKHFARAKNNKIAQSRLHFIINELGEKYFKIELLELCDSVDANEREQYYINKFKTLNPDFGYNTRKPSAKTCNITIDDDFEKLVVELYTVKRLTVSRIIKQLHIDHRRVKKILTKYNLGRSDGDSIKNTYAFPLSMIDIETDEILKSFENQYEATKYIQEHTNTVSSYDNVLKAIQMAARKKGERKSGIAYGYFWQKDGLSLFEERKLETNQEPKIKK